MIAMAMTIHAEKILEAAYGMLVFWNRLGSQKMGATRD